MSLQFHLAVEDMEIWSADSEGFSFVISYESPTGPGLHGKSLCRVMASALPEPWRDQGRRLAFQNFRRGRGRLQYHAETSEERKLKRGI